MGEDSGIAWTDNTFSPWIGCQKVSAGCKHCYAEQYVLGTGEDVWGPTAQRRRTGLKNWNKPLRWQRDAKAAGVRTKVFCSSLADVFEDKPELVPWREDLFKLIQATPDLDWLLLTKRPENLVTMLPWIKNERQVAPHWENVWLGTSVETQAMVDLRVPLLLRIPAKVSFLSAEPLLEAIDVSKWLWPMHWSWDAKYPTPEAALAAGGRATQKPQALISVDYPRVHWVIVGGESGDGARPFDLEWAHSLLRQSNLGKAAPFIKQLGAKPVECGEPLGCKDAAGGDMAEWPEALRVREFPR